MLLGVPRMAEYRKVFPWPNKRYVAMANDALQIDAEPLLTGVMASLA